MKPVAYFECVMREFEGKADAKYRIGTFKYEDTPHVERDKVLPMPADFVCDVELACRRVLRAHPFLWELWRGVWSDHRFSTNAVKTKHPKEYRRLANLCGHELLTVMPHLGGYWEMKHALRAALIEENRKTVAMMRSPEAQERQAEAAKLAARRETHWLKKRNARRRERYLERKAEASHKKESQKKVVTRKAA
jgi:hypothetical protein